MPNPSPLPSPEELSVLWPFTNPYGALTQPLVLAGDRLIGVSSATIFAVDIYHGKEVVPNNQTPQGFPYTLKAEFGDPHVTTAGGRVYFMDGDEDANSLIALRLVDAQPLEGWTAPTLKQVVSLFAVEGKVIAVHTDPGSGATFVTGFNGLTGSAAFGPVRISDQSPGAVAYGQGGVFFVAAGSLKAINVDFGDLRWQFTPPAGDPPLDLSVAPLVTNGLVFGASQNLLALDTARGQASWSVKPSGASPVKWFTPVLDDTGTIAIATNSGGDVFGISLLNGSLIWSTTVTDPGAPSVIGNIVSFTTEGGSNLARLKCADGKPVACYLLPHLAAKQAPVVGNGALFLTSDDGSVNARSFATQDAAFFDGVKSRIDIQPDGDQFDFGLDDFTVEAWFKSSAGGEIVSSYPTAGQSGDHGFRLNLTSDGHLRVAVVNSSLQVLNIGRTARTSAADGNWHHVAFLRRTGAFVVLLDGQAMDVRLPDTTPELNSIGGHNGLTIGAYVGAPGGTPEQNFRGLIREVRIWNRALDVAAIQTNLNVELTGQEPRLLGLWPLDDNQPPGSPIEPLDDNQVPGNPIEPRNAVSRHRNGANFVNAQSVPTDLVMDRSAFPYLIHESEPCWPYAGTWAARGEKPISTAPAVSSDGIIAFGTNNTVYAVRKMDGKRAWSFETPSGLSAPVSDGASFFILTGEESLVLLDSATGKMQQVDGFADLTKGDQGLLAAPAVSTDYIAAGSPTGMVYVAPRTTAPDVVTRQVNAGTLPVQRLEFIPGGLICAAGSAPSSQLNFIDPATGTVVGSIATVSPVFCVSGTSVICVQSDGLKRLNALLPLSAPQASSSAIEPSSITGLAAWPDSDLLVVTTNTGAVHRLSLAKMVPMWKAVLPNPTSGPNLVNPPTFDEAGRVFCTSSGGVLAVLDPDTGVELGLVTEAQPINTSALLDAGTAYFGCTDPIDSAADCDGALHSFVFGLTTALRLGVDDLGQPAAAANSYAVIDAETSDSTLHLMDVTESCIEAWINVPPADSSSTRAVAGGVLGICPSNATDAFALNLSVDPDGTIHYVARSLEASGWKGVSAAVSSKTLTGGSVCDGKWHHLAVSRSGESQLIIYVDGQALTGVTTTAITTTPAQTVTGLKAYLGATVAADLSAAQPFCGMIAEVRVWDTYLQATEIAARMHVKLRGDEPDILAYWNFDHEAVHDSARQGHDGVIAQPSAFPQWWLTDLPFTLPSYPHFVTAAQLTQVGDATLPSPASETIYSLKIKVQKADNTALGNQALDLWYVRHDDTEPLTITMDGVTITGVKPNEEPDPVPAGMTGTPVFCHTVTSLPDGSATVIVNTTLTGHGPSIDVRAPFMPVNERFHVNCLIDNQTLAKPVPPSLTAQTRLMQDYHYSAGNQIDETRDRSTHRVVLIAANPDHSLRAGEPLTLWASADMQIEVAGQSYTINADNSADFTATTHGELVVVVEASDFSTPTLYARAGFMHRNDRIVISPDEDGQKQLGNINEATLTTPTLGNWKPNHTDADKQTILNSEYAPHAAEIAQSVHHVMSAVQPAPAPPAAAPSNSTSLGLALSAMQPDFADMRQPLTPPRADRATLLRSTANVLRKPPINPDALRASLGGNLGFVFACDGTAPNFRFQLLATQEDVDRERGTPTTPTPALGGFFDSIWDGIKDAAEDVYEAARKVVVSVTNVVNVAIHTLDGIVHIVVDSIEKAVDAVVNFFKQLALAIELIILLLRALLDWGGIRDSAKLIQKMLDSIGVTMADSTFSKQITDGITSFFDSVENWLGTDTSNLSGTSAASYQEDSDTSVQDHANGVPAKMMFHKFQDNSSGGVFPSGFGGIPDGSDLDDMPYLQKIITDLVDGLMPLVPDLMSMDFHSMGTDLEAMLKTLAQDSLEFARKWCVAFVQNLFTGFTDMLSKIDEAAIDIPFLSALYKWITSDDLTIMKVACFLAGFPVHVVYFISTRGSRFSDDAANWFPAPAASAKTADSTALGFAAHANTADSMALGLAASDENPDSSGKEIAYTILKAFSILATIGTDATFRRTAGGSQAQRTQEIRNAFKIIRGMTGICSVFFPFYFTMPRYRNLLESAGGDPKVTDKINIAGLTLSLVSDGVTILGGARGLMGGSAQVGPDAAELPVRLPTGFTANAELAITGVNAVASVVLIILQIRSFATEEQYKDSFRDDGVMQAARLLGVRRIFFLVPKLFGWMFTQTNFGGNYLENPDTLLLVTSTRGLANVEGLTMHCTAAFNYLDL